MSSLLPNHDALVTALPDTAAGRVARQLAAAAAAAETWEQSDTLLGGVIATWQRR